MLVQNSYIYIHLGLLIRLLMNVSETDTKTFAKTSLDRLVENLQQGNFPVTLAAMRGAQFLGMRSKLDALKSDDDVLGNSLAKLIQDQSQKIETVIFAESSTKLIYVLPNRRFNSEYLMGIQRVSP